MLFSLSVMQAQERNVLGVPGVEHMSDDWHPHFNEMRQQGNYHINEVFSQQWFSTQSTIPINVGNLDLTVKNPVHSYVDVLGIGHDVGGLALRGLTETNNQIDAQILVGTPNRGSNFLRAVNYNQTGPSNIEKWLQNIARFQGDVECPECGKREMLLEFVERIKGQPYSLGAINDPNGYYSTLARPDEDLTAVIWGDAEGQTLGDFLSASTFASPIPFRECREELVAIKQAEIRNKELGLVIDQINGGFFGILKKIFKTIKDIIEDPEGTLIGAIESVWQVVDSTSETIKSQIEKLEDITDERRNLLLCELVNQRIEAEWVLTIMQGGSELAEQVIEGPDYDPELCEHYTYQCQYNTYHPNHASFCYFAEVHCAQTVIELVPEVNDLVYTRTEQTIEAWPIDMQFRIEANHFQEQLYSYNRVPIDILFTTPGLEPFHVPRY